MTMTATHAIATATFAAQTESPTESPLEQLDAHVVSWLSPEEKLWVASQYGEFAGFVEFREGHFEVTNAQGRRLESRSSLRDAKKLIDEPIVRSGTSTILMFLAMGAGATAVSFLAIGLGIIRLA